MNKYKAAFPSIANYNVAIELFIKSGLNIDCLKSIPITKKTLDLGTKYSPDYVCSPFKYNLGNYIEALENGANLLFQSSGGCRVSYYGELQEKILKDLGYNFEFIQLPFKRKKELWYLVKRFKDLKIKINFFKIFYYLLLSLKMIKKIDIFEDYLRKNIGFEVVKGNMEKIWQQFLDNLKEVNSFKKLNKVFKKSFFDLKNSEINKSSKYLKVGVVGELYTLMDSYSNHFLEMELAKKGIEITRFVNLDYLLLKKAQKEKKLLSKKNNYVKYDLGAGGTDSVIKSIYFANNFYDGIIHVKSFGCVPEINAMPILQNIASDFNIPILYFSFDTATSDTGVKTRLEAFCDMLEMRKKNEEKLSRD